MRFCFSSRIRSEIRERYKWSKANNSFLLRPPRRDAALLRLRGLPLALSRRLYVFCGTACPVLSGPDFGPREGSSFAICLYCSITCGLEPSTNTFILSGKVLLM